MSRTIAFEVVCGVVEPHFVTPQEAVELVTILEFQ